MEKGGLCEALGSAGVTKETALGFADEMRVGLRGMVRRVWGRRGVKCVSECRRCTSGGTCSVWWTDAEGSCCGTG